MRTRNEAPPRSSSNTVASPAELLLAIELRQHPADRRVARLADGARDEEPVDRAGHRDVVEAQPLRAAGLALGVEHLVVAEDGLALTGGRVDDLEAEAPVGEREDLVGRRRPAEIAARVGDDDDLELEPLRGVDRQEAHGVGALFLGHRLELRGAEGLLVAQEADEALQIAAAHLLVGAREPHQLAEVRVPAAAVPAREHREVVVVAGDDELAEPLERRTRPKRPRAARSAA